QGIGCARAIADLAQTVHALICIQADDRARARARLHDACDTHIGNLQRRWAGVRVDSLWICLQRLFEQQSSAQRQSRSLDHVTTIESAHSPLLLSSTYSLPNFFTASTMDLSFSMYAYIECSLKSISCAVASTSAALARGTTTTPSESATTMSPAL